MSHTIIIIIIIIGKAKTCGKFTMQNALWISSQDIVDELFTLPLFFFG
jgi:hypothetical protein